MENGFWREWWEFHRESSRYVVFGIIDGILIVFFMGAITWVLWGWGT